MKILILLAASAASLFGQCTGYSKHLTVTINRAMFGAGTIANYPLGILKRQHVWLQSVANGGYIQNSSGYDQCFSDLANTVSYGWESVAFDGATGTVTEYVRVPVINGSDQASNTQIFVWFGKAAQVAPTGAWESSFKLVQHFTAGPNVADSTGLNTCTNTAGTTGAGIQDKALSLDGVATHYASCVSGPLTFASQITVEAWFNKANPFVVGDSSWLVTNWDAVSTTGFTLYLPQPACFSGTGNQLGFYIGNASSTTYSCPDDRISPNVWYYAAGTYDNVTIKTWLNGGLSNRQQTAANRLGASPAPAYIGGNSFNGQLDEVRVSNTVRPQIYFTAVNNNYRYPQAIVAFSDAANQPTAGPAIGNASAAGYANSIVLTWDTDTYANSKAQCGTLPGGPYTVFATPVVHPVKTGDSFFGKLHHSIALTGLASTTQYYCQAVSDNSWSQANTGTATSSVIPVLTTAATIYTRMSVTENPGIFRINDQYNGANGTTNTGQWIDGDTNYLTMLPDGRWLGSGEDCGGVKGAGSNGICVTIWPTADFLNPIKVANYGPPGSLAPMEAVTFDGTTQFNQSLVGQGASIGAGGNGACCQYWYSLIASSLGAGGGTDGLVTTVLPQDNVNQWVFGKPGIGQATSLTPTAIANGTGTQIVLSVPGLIPVGAQIAINGISACSLGNPNTLGTTTTTVLASTATTVTYDLGVAVTITGCVLTSSRVMATMLNDVALIPWVTCNGTADSCPHIAGLDGWAYATATLGSHAGVVLMSIRLEDLALKDWSKVRFYIGTQTGADGMADSAWDSSAAKVANATALAGTPYTYRTTGTCKPHMQVAADFGGFILACNTDPWGGMTSNGVVSYSMQYPWSIPTDIAGISVRDTLQFPYYEGSVFLNWLPGSYTLQSSNPLTAKVSAVASGTAAHLNHSSVAGDTTMYTTWLRYLTVTPWRAEAKQNWIGRGAKQIPSNGLLFTYLHRDHPISLVKLDETGKYPIVMGAGTNCIDRYGECSLTIAATGNFNYPLLTGVQNKAYNTGMATPLTDFSYAWCGAHSPATPILAAVSGEIIMQKAGDLKIARHLTSDTWDVIVSGATIGALPLTDNTFGCFLVTRNGSTVNAYTSAGIGSTLPLTIAATGSAGTVFTGSSLNLGDATNAAHVTHSVNAVWNRALTDSELISLRASLAAIMAGRGAAIP